MASPVISCEEFESLRNGPNPPLVFECTWISIARAAGYQGLKAEMEKLGGQEKLEKEAFEAGHIPGAVPMDVQRDLSAEIDKEVVKFTFTRQSDAGKLSAKLGAMGIPNAKASIVLYGRPTVGPAHPAAVETGVYGPTRCWWTLNTWGFTNVRVLDGGFDAWKAAGGKPQAGAAAPKPVSFDQSSLVDKAQLKATTEDVVMACKPNSGVQLMDALPGWPNTAQPYARDAARQGHIEGAHGVDARDLLDLNNFGKFKDKEQMRATFQKNGTDLTKPIIGYCGGGITISLNVMALNMLGVEAKLYDDSLTGWTRDKALPMVPLMESKL